MVAHDTGEDGLESLPQPGLLDRSLFSQGAQWTIRGVGARLAGGAGGEQKGHDRGDECEAQHGQVLRG